MAVAAVLLLCLSGIVARLGAQTFTSPRYCHARSKAHFHGRLRHFLAPGTFAAGTAPRTAWNAQAALDPEGYR